MTTFYDLTPCPDCHGAPILDGPCCCGGEGQLPCPRCGWDGPDPHCPQCLGTGVETCGLCLGDGRARCPTCMGMGHLPPEVVGEIERSRRLKA